MSDLISRQAAIDAIKTWGLIDGLSEGQAIEILADKEKLPTADVVPVVRCRDCKYYEGRHWCGLNKTNFDPDEFCSYGERREE